MVAWGLESNLGESWDHRGTEVQYLVNAGLKFAFRHNTTIYFPIWSVQSDTLRPQEFSGLMSNRKFNQDSIGVEFATAPIRQLAFRSIIYRQGAINLVVPPGQMPTGGDETTVNNTLTIRPSTRLQIDSTYILDRVVHNPLRHAVFNNHIIRSRWNYQLTKELSFRVITQYNGLLTNPTYSSLQTSACADTFREESNASREPTAASQSIPIHKRQETIVFQGQLSVSEVTPRFDRLAGDKKRTVGS